MSKVNYIPFNKAFINVPIGKYKIQENSYLQKGNYKIVDQGKSQIAGYSNEKEFLKTDFPYILFGDHTKVIKYIDFPFIAGADGVRLYKASENFEPKFLYHYLSSINLPSDSYGRHSKYLEELLVPELNISIQQEIVDHLDNQLSEIEKAREATAIQRVELKKLLDKLLENEIETVLNSIGEPIRLGDIIEITAKMANPTSPKYCDLLHVSAENIESVTGKLINLKSAKDDGMASNKYKFEKGDVLYSKLRPYLRKVALPDFSGLCSADMYPLKCNSDLIDSRFLKLLLTSKVFTEYANEMSARSRMPKLNRDQLYNWKFSLPSIEIQNSLTEKIEQAMKICAVGFKASDSVIASINILPSKLLQEAFNEIEND